MSDAAAQKRRALIEALLKEQGVAISAGATIQPRPDPAIVPLSLAQERLWYLDRLAPASAAYSIPKAFRLTGVLDVGALIAGLNMVVQRHDILRSFFPADAELPAQEISPRVAVDIPVVDLVNFRGAAQSDEVARRIADDARRPIALHTAPLFRAQLLQLAADTHILLFTIHHIITDGWSLAILLRAWSENYNAEIAGNAAPLAPLVVQYADFAAWQNANTAAPTIAAQQVYWDQKLANLSPTPELATDSPRAMVQTFAGRWTSSVLPAPLGDAVHAFAGRGGFTILIPFLTAFYVLLNRYTQQNDLIVGSPITLRNHPELANMLGHFVGMQALRTDLGGNPTFAEAAQRVHATVRDAFTNPDVALEDLLNRLDVERTPNKNPLFQTVFMVQQSSPESDWRGALALNGIVSQAISSHSQTAKFDLTIEIEEHRNALTLAAEYNSDLFRADTIERLLAHLVILLDAGLRNPDTRIADLPILTAQEKTWLAAWNAPHKDARPDACIHDLFAAQAAQTPNAIALHQRGRTLSYVQLNQHANQLAHELRARGARPDTAVAVFMARGIEMVIALLAVLKSGAGYIPIDPGYPAERIAYMLADAQAPLVITSQSLVRALPAGSATTIVWEDVQDALAQQSDKNPPHRNVPSHLAYLIYTSGSTGQPKGVATEHRGLLNLVRWHRRAFNLTPEDKATQIAGLSFDAAVWDIWPPLLCGASVAFPPDEETRITPKKLQAWLLDARITISFLPTPLAELVLQLSWPTQTPLRLMLTGGDKLHNHPPPNLPFALINNYGNTENSVVSTSGRVSPTPRAHKPPTIGASIDNVQLYILDAALEPVPIGVPGEIYLGGKSLARGYHNLPAMTAERFVPNPFDVATSGARMYRTGDRARYLRNGEIEFMSRLDRQVKIRGFRVELGEIETTIARSGMVQDGVVLTTMGQPATSSLQLAAFVVANPPRPEIIPALRAYLEARLPYYMVPSLILSLENLPSTASGKVDRDALRELATQHTANPDTSVAPVTDTERMIAAIWQKVLGIAAVGIEDNFFDIGGHSLLLFKIYHELKKNVDRDFTVITLFNYPTVKTLAYYFAHTNRQSPPEGGLDDALTRAETRKRNIANLSRRRNL